LLLFEVKNVQNKNLHASVEENHVNYARFGRNFSYGQFILYSVLEPSDEASSNNLCQQQDAIPGHCWFDTGSKLHVQNSPQQRMYVWVKKHF